LKGSTIFTSDSRKYFLHTGSVSGTKQLGLEGFLMIVAILTAGLLVGMILGQRFKVLVLVPTMALAFASALAMGTARGEDAFDAFLMGVAIIMTALQAGYFVGAVLINVVDRLADQHHGRLSGSVVRRFHR
jgi:hypothetical protein